MFKKYSILVWLSLLLILVGIYIVVEYTGSADRTFKSKVIIFEEERITGILINNVQKNLITEIKKEGDEWYIYEGIQKFSCEPKAVNHVLDLLNNLGTESIVATKSDKWLEYKVDEEQAILVELYENNEMVDRLYVGKFGFKAITSDNPQQQQTAKMTSYIRPEGDDMVYAVDGLIRTNFQEGKDPFRNSKLFWIDEAQDISKISIESHYETLVLDMTTSDWRVNELTADSTKTARYLASLAHLNSKEFINDVDVTSMAPTYTMRIEGSSFAPVTLKAYQADTIIGHYVTSSSNPGSVFDGSKGRLFEKAFVGKEKFLFN